MTSARKPDTHLHGAFDTVRFGAANILNLREGLPRPSDATQRAELWIRQRQVEGVDEVLVITGRGKNSDGGLSTVREAIIRLIASLRRRGVIERSEEHNAGSFSITLASMQSMIDVPRRRREPVRPPMHTAPALADLTPGTRRLLKDVAERSLDGLGVKDTSAFVEAEMIRQITAISATLPPDGDRDARLRAALRRALDSSL